MCRPPVFVVVDRGADQFAVVPAAGCSSADRPVAMFYGSGGAGAAVCDPALQRDCGLSFECMHQGFAIDGRLLELTEQEFAVLALLVAAPQRAWTRPELARLIWRAPAGSTADVLVRVRVHNLRHKLGRHAAAIRTERTVGYRFVPVLQG